MNLKGVRLSGREEVGSKASHISTPSQSSDSTCQREIGIRIVTEAGWREGQKLMMGSNVEKQLFLTFITE